MNVLFLTHRLPYAPNRGDRIRSYYLLREMSRFARVSLISLVHDAHEAAQVGHVPFAQEVVGLRVSTMRNRIKGIARLLTTRPLTHSLLDAPGLRDAIRSLAESCQPDVVVAYCSSMARLALEPPLAWRPLVLDMVDLDSAKWNRLAGASTGALRFVYRREARTLERFEARIVRHAVTSLVVNERERDALLSVAPGAPVAVVPNGIDLEAFAPGSGPAPGATVIFCGVMSYTPNVEGICWFVSDVWPRVRAARPDARLILVGADPAREIRALPARDDSITVTGTVQAVQPYLWEAAVSIAPLRVTQGLQNKVLEALAAGLPVVTTPAVFGGLPTAARSGCLVAGDEAAFAEALLQLLALSPAERRGRAGSAQLDRLGWPAQLSELESILRAAVERRPCEPPRPDRSIERSTGLAAP